jgi:DNA-binding NarL/FixJ family response regulator
MAMSGQVRVCLVDDHSLFRRGLAALLRTDERVEVVGEAANGLEAVEMVRRVGPDAVLMDLHMPSCNGIEACRKLRDGDYRGGILMLTVSERDEDLFDALGKGANGYLLKDSELEELVSAIQHVARGGVVVSPSLAGLVQAALGAGRTPVAAGASDGLSDREREVLQLVAAGRSNRDIADALCLSENTVKTHLRHIMEKLQLESRYEVVSYAARNGAGGQRQSPAG